MRTKIWLVAAMSGLLLLTASPGFAQDSTQDPPHAQATAPVQVTTNPDPSRAHAAPLIDVHPDTEELVILETEHRRRMDCSVHVSSDGGQRWFSGGEVMEEPYTDCGSDPMSTNNSWLTFGEDGVLYVVFTAHDPQFNDRGRGDLPRHVFLARSTDGGRTFDTSMLYEAPEEIDEDDGRNVNRRPRVEVDPSDPDNVYVSWQQRGSGDEASKAMVMGSDDGGDSFSEPVVVSDERGAYQARIAVDPDGVVHAVLPTLGQTPEDEDPLPRAVDYRRSTDGGQSWSEPQELHAGHMGWGLGRKWELTADPDDGTLYAIWYGALDPELSEADTDRDVFMRVSHDGGDTWESPVQINDSEDREWVEQYDPGIAVAPNGRVDVAWFDFRNSPYPERPVGEEASNFDGFQDVYYSNSTDQGETFMPNARITDRSINREVGVWSNNSHIHGHVGIASTEDTVYMTWQDTRNANYENQAEDVYFASYQVDDANPAAASLTVPGLPAWAAIAAALAAGMGIAMVLSWLLLRRTVARG